MYFRANGVRARSPPTTPDARCADQTVAPRQNRKYFP